ncbi:MAG: hypothetical protein AAF468_22505, partial [Pseudomonadota bacterium]
RISEVSSSNMKPIKSISNNIDQQDLYQRPTGNIDVREQSYGHSLIMSNRFGRCIGGSHPSLEENTRKIIQHVQVLHIDKISISEFFETENLGVECSPKCGSCKCGKCPIGGKPFTLKEEREQHQIEEGLTFKTDHWEAQYPWIRNPNDLTNNRHSAMAMLKSTERRLLKNTTHAETYNNQIKVMVQRGVARKLLPSEIKSYAGPVFYLSHHEVIKPESESTPCRIVFNASANYQGHILNEHWASQFSAIRAIVTALHCSAAASTRARARVSSRGSNKIHKSTTWMAVVRTRTVETYVILAVQPSRSLCESVCLSSSSLGKKSCF